MKTSHRDGYGPPDILTIREAPVPEPGKGEVLVRVRATTVNRTDCGVLSGEPFIFRFFVGFPKPRHAATGTDFAGEVVRVGQDVTAYKAGDRVFGFHDHGIGSHAECFTVASSTPMARIPDAVSFENAAASLEGAHYAITFITKIGVEPGDHVLVYGASGAIGSAAVQVLRHLGARVTAVCGTKTVARVAGLGPERVIDYETGDFTRELAGEKFPFVMDAVGKRSFGACKPLLTERGVYVSSELGPYMQNPLLALAAPVMRGPKVRFPIPDKIADSLALIVRMLNAGAFEPLIDRTYPLDQIRDAFTYVRSGQKVGNVLLAMP